MTSVVYTAGALEDLDRLTDFLVETDPPSASDTAAIIGRALMMLEEHPYIGRPVNGDLRELVISRGRTGYVALYVYREALDTVLILAVRHQRESGLGDQA